MSYYYAETSVLTYSGFADLAGTFSSLTLTVVWAESAISINPTTELLTLDLDYSVDGGASWISIYSGPGNELGNGVQQTSNMTLSTALAATLSTDLLVRITPTADISGVSTVVSRMCFIYEIYVTAVV